MVEVEDRWIPVKKEGKINQVQIKGRKGEIIKSVDDWFQFAPPEGGKDQWVDGRSAKELANAWFGTPIVPLEISHLFESHPSTQNLVIEVGYPELETKLDDFPGKGRQSDLILLGRLGQQKILIAIEAKADEPFDETIEKRLNEHRSVESNIFERINKLSLSIFGRTVNHDERLKHLHYQLLHGLGGALIEAKNREANLAIFVVHEFRSLNLDWKKVQDNAEAFESFVKLLLNSEIKEIVPGHLYGPIVIPGDPDKKFVPGNLPCLIGKVTTNLS